MCTRMYVYVQCVSLVCALSVYIQLRNSPLYIIEGEPTSMVSSYKYLGYIFDGVPWADRHGEDEAEAGKRNYWMHLK